MQDIRSAVIEVSPNGVMLCQAGRPSIFDSKTSVWWFRSGSVPTADLAPDDAQLARDEGPHLLVGLLRSAGVRWFDDPAIVQVAEQKLYQLRVAKALGIATPDWTVTNSVDTASAFAKGRTVVAKALSPGVGIAPFVTTVGQSDLHQVAVLPVFLQNRVDSSADFRVVSVRSQSWVWRRIREETTVDWRVVDPSGKGFSRVAHDKLSSQARRVQESLGLTMSVQDWLETKAGPVFLEANPQGAWMFLETAEVEVATAFAHHLLGGSID